MNGPNLTDLALLVPEMIPVGAALTLILFARRIQNASLVTAATVVAALAAAVASIWLLADLPETGFKTGFGDMSQDRNLASMRRFGEDVMPAFTD